MEPRPTVRSNLEQHAHEMTDADVSWSGESVVRQTATVHLSQSSLGTPLTSASFDRGTGVVATTNTTSVGWVLARPRASTASPVRRPVERLFRAIWRRNPRRRRENRLFGPRSGWRDREHAAGIAGSPQGSGEPVAMGTALSAPSVRSVDTLHASVVGSKEAGRDQNIASAPPSTKRRRHSGRATLAPPRTRDAWPDPVGRRPAGRARPRPKGDRLLEHLSRRSLERGGQSVESASVKGPIASACRWEDPRAAPRRGEMEGHLARPRTPG